MSNDRVERCGEDELGLEQALRRSHCSRSKSDPHACIGSLSVLPDRVVLSCKACGVERIDCLPRSSNDILKADAILSLAKAAIKP